jgi:hypothetical protein
VGVVTLKRRRPLAGLSRAELLRAVRRLARENRAMRIELAGIYGAVGDVIPFTLDQEFPKGTTIRIPVPRRFVVRL